MLENRSDEIMVLLPNDDALLNACHVAMAAAQMPLSQQLLSLRETVDMLLPLKRCHVVDDGARGVARGNGVVAGGVEEVDMAEEDGVDMGPGVVEGVGVAGGLEVGVAGGVNVEVGVVGEEGVEVGVVGGEGVMTEAGVCEENGVEGDVGGGELGVEVLNNGRCEPSPGGLSQEEEGSRKIAVNVDFPCGPSLQSALEEEPDLDATLLQADEDSNPTHLNSDPTLLDSGISDVDFSGSLVQEKSSEVPVLDRNADVGVARSHFKVIPLPVQNQFPPVNGTRTPDSTPSSSVGGSIGQLSLSREGATILGSADVSKTAEHVHSPARRSWQSEERGKAESDDVIAVPMIVRSTSTG